MKFTLEQREALNDLVDQNLDGEGMLLEKAYRRSLEDFLAEEHEAGRLPELFPDMARKLARTQMEERRWLADGVPENQLVLSSLFEADAMLALGDGSYIRMGNARADHLERVRTIRTKVFQDHSAQYFAQVRYFDSRIPELRTRDCTLEEFEAEISFEGPDDIAA